MPRRPTATASGAASDRSDARVPQSELHALRNRYTPEATAAKQHILGALLRVRSMRASALGRLHDDLLFLRAFPDDRRVYEDAGSALAALARVARRLRAATRARLDDTGIAGTVSRHVYPHATAAWMVASYPLEVEIDWRALDATAVDPVLRGLVVRAEEDAFDSEGLTQRRWLDAARDPDAPSVLAWLLGAGPSMPGGAQMFRLLYDAARMPVRWNLARSHAATTFNEWHGAPVVFRRRMRPAPAQPIRHVATPLARVTLLSPDRGRAVIDVARAALAVRCREVYPISLGNPAEVWLADLGEGTSAAVIGTMPNERMSVEANYGYLLMANGVPIGYGGVTPLLFQANTGINVFSAFRGSEAAMLWAQLLRAFHTIFGVTRFVVNDYQFGHGNPEAIASGAFWFYYRLGFRPADPLVRKEAAAEAARMRGDREYRSSRATLKRLARGDLHLTLPGFDPRHAIDEQALARRSLEVTRLIGGLSAAPRARSGTKARLVDTVARALGARGRGGWPRPERAAFERLAPLVALLPGLDRRPASTRAHLVRLMRAKGASQERDFVHVAHESPALFLELLGIARG